MVKEMAEERVPKEGYAAIVPHLYELRRRVFYVALLLCVTCSVGYVYADLLYQFLLAPLREAYQASGHAQAMPNVMFTGLTEAFFTHIKLAIFMGIFLGFPFICWHVYAFVAPGLYRNERWILTPFLLMAPLLFVAGAALAYYGIFPLAWQFFLGFEVVGGDAADTVPIALHARMGEYLSLVMGLILAFGLAFQLPLILMLLCVAGIVDVQSLRQKRKYALVGFVALAAVLTPPDVISQIGLALPLYLLYELAIFGSLFLGRKKRKNA